MLAAIEVSTRISSVALLDPATGGELGEAALPDGWESAATLVPTLEALLRERGLSAKDLAGVAVSVGPGSFTGIRVGLATAEGICLPGNLPAFGISTLDGLAENLRAAGLTGEALCLVDAQRGECFAGRYRIEKDSFQEWAPPQILGLERLGSLIKGKTWVVGPGALKYEKEIHESLGAQGPLASQPLQNPQAMSIARIAYRKWRQGARPALTDLKPLYLRLPAVEEKK